MAKRRTSRTLIDSVSKEAERSFPLEMINLNDSDENYLLWLEHLLKTSKKVHARFQEEGLVLTCEKIQEYITWQEEYIEREREQKRNRKVLFPAQEPQHA